jgi:glycosyltransferase involved in cell wall biosynthesis
MNPAKFGIVIPCFNEAGNLPRLISECEQSVKNGIFHFVLVNNGSNDSSIKILNRVQNSRISVLNLETNRGYGGGILEGLDSLQTEFVGWIHADLQTNLKDSLTVVESQSFEFFKGIRTGRTPMEHILSLGMGIICSILFKAKLHEINAQPTIMKRFLFESWISPPTDFSLDLYSLVIAKKAKVKVARSKFIFKERIYGKSSWNFGLNSRLRMISRTLRYAWALRQSGVK